MATGTAGDQARVQPRQVVNTWRKQINFGDAGNGVNQNGVMLPAGAFISFVAVEIVTAFDGTASIIVGTGATPNNIVATGDVNELVAAVYVATRGYGRSLTAAADTQVYTRLTSTSPTVGQAEIVIQYEGNAG